MIERVAEGIHKDGEMALQIAMEGNNDNGEA